MGHTQETRYSCTNPGQLTIGDVVFDSYETRESVRELYIDRLERLMEPHPDLGHPPALRFIWGEFTGASDPGYWFYLEGLDVDYTLFLPSGRPVRAKVKLSLRQCWPIKDQQHVAPRSESEATIHQVLAGDTLQGLAAEKYGDPGAWRTIAEANDIDDPMVLPPGTALLMPAA